MWAIYSEAGCLQRLNRNPFLFTVSVPWLCWRDLEHQGWLKQRRKAVRHGIRCRPGTGTPLDSELSNERWNGGKLQWTLAHVSNTMLQHVGHCDRQVLSGPAVKSSPQRNWLEPPEVRGEDPDTKEEIVLEPADPWAGIRKLMTALEESMGRTMLDRKGELRKQFYTDLRRLPGERISAFCSRFRTLTSEMKREGITLHSDELGWFLRNRMGLDAIRIQLLDTALRGREAYEEVEQEALRLFRDLHSEDPVA